MIDDNPNKVLLEVRYENWKFHYFLHNSWQVLNFIIGFCFT